MQESHVKGHHSQQPPSGRGQPLPRRTSPANSVTLKHHRLARDASLRASAGSGPANNTDSTCSPGRNSPGESHYTGQSDPTKWFDQSNQNPMATFDNNIMEGLFQACYTVSDSLRSHFPQLNHRSSKKNPIRRTRTSHSGSRSTTHLRDSQQHKAAVQVITGA